MRTALHHARRGAALTEYALLASLVAVAAISAVLLMGNNTRLPLCVAEARVSEHVLGAPSATPCEVPDTPPPPPPPPPPPTTVLFQLPTETPGFLNPPGGPAAIEALVEGQPLIGHPQQQVILDALCLALGHLAPASGAAAVPAENGDARFLTGGRWVWRDTGIGFAWEADTALPPYGLGDGAIPVLAQLSCHQPAP